MSSEGKKEKAVGFDRARYKTFLILGGLAIVMAIVLAACGSDPTPTPTRPAATATPVPTATPLPPGVTPPRPTSTPRPAPPTPTPPPSVVDFGGKTVRITVGFSPGGGFDTFARIFAVHLKEALPGKPNVIVANLPGANTLVAAKSAVDRPLSDSTVDVVLVISSLITGAVLGTVEGFEPTDLTYLGAPDFSPSDNTWCVRTSVVDSLDGFFAANRNFTLAQIGPTDGYGLNSAWAVDRGLPFTLVYGYGGTSEMNAAFNRREVEITPTCRDSEVQLNPDWGTGFATPLFYQTAEPKWVTDGKAAGKWSWVTSIAEVAQERFGATDEEVAAIKTLNAIDEATRVFGVPTNTAADVVDAMRAAFAEIVASNAFVADMEARIYTVGLLTGDELQTNVEKLNDLTPAGLEIVKGLFAPR